MFHYNLFSPRLFLEQNTPSYNHTATVCVGHRARWRRRRQLQCSPHGYSLHCCSLACSSTSMQAKHVARKPNRVHRVPDREPLPRDMHRTQTTLSSAMLPIHNRVHHVRPVLQQLLRLQPNQSVGMCPNKMHLTRMRLHRIQARRDHLQAMLLISQLLLDRILDREVRNTVSMELRHHIRLMRMPIRT